MSIHLAVIGTAGRKDDGPRLSKDLYLKYMVPQYIKVVTDIRHKHPDEKIDVSLGGAAWADHVAVTCLLAGCFRENLGTVYLWSPSPMSRDMEFVGEGSAARTARYYHEEFRKKTQIRYESDFQWLKQMIGQKLVISCADGKSFDAFKERNLQLAQKANVVIAFTFGTKSTGWVSKGSASECGLKDGGTAHTWNNLPEGTWRRHFSLTDIQVQPEPTPPAPPDPPKKPSW